jgi:hypothetical protein
MLARISTLFCSFLILQATSSPPQNVIHVAIDGFHTDKGQVTCSLYSSAEGFPKNDRDAVAHSKSAGNLKPWPTSRSRSVCLGNLSLVENVVWRVKLQRALVREGGFPVMWNEHWKLTTCVGQPYAAQVFGKCSR